jgi:hypothetical protein
VSRISRICGNLDLSQPYGSSRPVTGIAYKENTTYGLMISRLYYELIWLKIGAAKQLLVKRFHVEFYEDLIKGLSPETRSQTDGHARHPHKVVFLLCKERMKSLD